MHYYSHHIGDFVRDTSRLNDAQCMAYLRLMWLYYENEQPLQDDIKILAFKIGSDENTVSMLLQCYFYANAMRWHHKRIDDELNKYKNKSELARNSAKSRWNNANAMRTHTESNAKAMLTNNQEPITNNHIKNITQKNEFFADIDNEILMQWIAVRTKKRAAKLSQIVYNAMVRESGLANITLEQAVIVCVERNWIAFNSEWYQKGSGQNKPMKGHGVVSDSDFIDWRDGNGKLT